MRRLPDIDPDGSPEKNTRIGAEAGGRPGHGGLERSAVRLFAIGNRLYRVDERDQVVECDDDDGVEPCAEKEIKRGERMSTIIFDSARWGHFRRIAVPGWGLV